MSTSLEKLVRIPHLNLTPYLPKVDLIELLKDYSQFKNEDFYPYDAAVKNSNFKNFLAKNWTGCSLIDALKTGKQFTDYYSSDLNSEESKFNFDVNNKPVYEPTEVGKKCPNILNYIYKIIENPQRTRLSRIPKKSHIHWHSHKILTEYGSNFIKKFSSGSHISLILHIPLTTNEKCWMGVSSQHPTGGFPYNIYKQHYGLGEIWILNGYYYHNVFNGGDTDRDHIYLHTNTYDKKLKPILEKACEEYKGPLIKNEIIPQRLIGSINLDFETGLPINALTK